MRARRFTAVLTGLVILGTFGGCVDGVEQGVQQGLESVVTSLVQELGNAIIEALFNTGGSA